MHFSPTTVKGHLQQEKMEFFRFFGLHFQNKPPHLRNLVFCAPHLIGGIRGFGGTETSNLLMNFSFRPPPEGALVSESDLLYTTIPGRKYHKNIVSGVFGYEEFISGVLSVQGFTVEGAVIQDVIKCLQNIKRARIRI